MLLYPTISDHDALYIIANVCGKKFQSSIKYIRSIKCFDLKALPFSLIYSFDDLNEQPGTPNELILDCIFRHAPLIKTKCTHPPAPWMKHLDNNYSGTTLWQTPSRPQKNVRYREVFAT